MSTQRKIACLVFPDVMSLDVTGPVQVFASANVELQRQGRVAVYQPLLLGESLEPVASSCGIRLGVDACWHDLAPAELDTLLVPGGQGVELERQNPALLAWLRRAEGEVRRLGSVCSGALLLAEAGLLQGHRATTHWPMCRACSALPTWRCRATDCIPSIPRMRRPAICSPQRASPPASTWPWPWSMPTSGDPWPWQLPSAW